MKLPRLVGLEGLQSDGKGTVTFQFKSNDGRSHYVPMQVGVINALLGPIFSIRNELDERIARNGGVQAIAVTSVRPAVLEDGRPILELSLDGLPLRVSVPREGLPAFRSVLNQLEEMSDLSPKGPTN